VPPHEIGQTVLDVLHNAVARIDGQRRSGQDQMADAVAESFETGQHLLVQAGTGTGKSLAYLVPAAVRAAQGSGENGPVVVATATLALQSQLVERDLPALAPVVEQVLDRPLTWAVAKGRSNYACLHRVREGVPDEDGALMPAESVAAGAAGQLGRDVVRARRWAEDEVAHGTGERDRLQPGISDRAWAQVSVTARECLGAARCRYGTE
jgi:ATP-dependent DNA helicase DinG